MLPDTAHVDLTAGHRYGVAPNQLPWYELYFQQTFFKEIKLYLFINSKIYYKQFVIFTLHRTLLMVTKLKLPCQVNGSQVIS